MMPSDNDRLMRITPGMAAQQIYAGSCGKSQNIAVVNGKLYAARPSANRLQRMNTNGTTLETIYTDMTTLPYSVAVDTSSNVFWADAYTHKLMLSTYSTAWSSSVFSDALGTSPLVAVDAMNVYWSTGMSLVKLDKGTPLGTPTPLGSSMLVNSIAMDANYLYVTDAMTSSVYRICKADGTSKLIVTGQQVPRGISLDTSGASPVIYWANYADGTIMQASSP
jgi:hypothetical protein